MQRKEILHRFRLAAAHLTDAAERMAAAADGRTSRTMAEYKTLAAKSKEILRSAHELVERLHAKLSEPKT